MWAVAPQLFWILDLAEGPCCKGWGVPIRGAAAWAGLYRIRHSQLEDQKALETGSLSLASLLGGWEGHGTTRGTLHG